MIQHKFLCCLFLLAIAGTVCFSQAKHSKNSPEFHSINQVGLLEGSTGSFFQLQTIGGIEYKKWFAGLGAGLDYYRYRGFPVFVDLRRHFGNSVRSFFIYADAGVHFIWVRDQDKKVSYSNQDDRFSNGFYSDAGLGYQLRLKTGPALLFSAGFSYKKITETWTTPYYLTADSKPETQHYDYYLNRLTIKIGFQL